MTRKIVICTTGVIAPAAETSFKHCGLSLIYGKYSFAAEKETYRYKFMA